MRGTDFRGELTLFLGAKFSSKYEQSQGLSRVGRFGDKCKRIQVGPDGGKVDASLQLKHSMKLEAYLEHQQERN